MKNMVFVTYEDEIPDFELNNNCIVIISCFDMDWIYLRTLQL